MRNQYFALLMCCAVTSACELSDRPDDRSSQAQAVLAAPTTIAPTSGYGDPGSVTTVDAAGNVNWVGGNWHVPLPVSVGDVIGSVSAIVRDNGAANGHTADGNVIVMQLISHTSLGDNARATIISSGSGSQQTLTLAPSGGYRVQSGEDMLVMLVGFRALVPSMAGLVTVSPLAPSGTATIGTLILSSGGVALKPAGVTFVGDAAGSVSWTGGAWSVQIPCNFGDTIDQLTTIVIDGISSPITASVVVVGQSGGPVAPGGVPPLRTIATLTTAGDGKSHPVVFTPGYVVQPGEGIIETFTPTAPSIQSSVGQILMTKN